MIGTFMIFFTLLLSYFSIYNKVRRRSYATNKRHSFIQKVESKCLFAVFFYCSKNYK